MLRYIDIETIFRYFRYIEASLLLTCELMIAWLAILSGELNSAHLADHVTAVSTHCTHAHTQTKMAALEQRPVSSSVNGDVDVTLDVPGDMTEEDVVDEEDIQKEVRTIA